MTDLLIRNIDPALKRRLEARARRSGRSLSEEAKALLRGSVLEAPAQRPIGTALVELFRSDPIELEISRDELPRPPPDFE